MMQTELPSLFWIIILLVCLFFTGIAVALGMIAYVKIPNFWKKIFLSVVEVIKLPFAVLALTLNARHSSYFTKIFTPPWHDHSDRSAKKG